MGRNITRFLILFISIAFIAIGVLREEQLVVLQKAIAICLECIGVG
jgi:hypothetical protein